MISIIIPSYNQQEYLPDAIESALGQSLKSEVIVIDDGSTDNSLEIAKKYPVKVISQVNKGLSSARNTGIMNATGDYILPLDSDDILMPECVEEMQKVIDKTHADIIAPSFKCFGTINHEVIIQRPPTLEEMKSANRIGYFCAIRKSGLLEVGGYSPKMVFGYEDFHLWFDLMKRGKSIAVIPKTMVLYRTKERSMIHTALEHHEELIGQIKKDHSDVYTEN